MKEDIIVKCCKELTDEFKEDNIKIGYKWSPYQPDAICIGIDADVFIPLFYVTNVFIAAVEEKIVEVEIKRQVKEKLLERRKY